MTGFFINRTKLQLTGDIANAALGSARRGVFGTLLLSAAESSVPAVGTIATMAGACALGGAISIIPAMVVHKMLMSEPNPKASFLAQMATLTANICFRTAFAVTSACVGAAVLGLAMTPVLLTSITASLTFGLLGLMSHLIVAATRSEERKVDDFLAANIAI